MKSIICIAHDIRSAHNVGSLLRTSEGLGVEKVYLTGYTPYPIKQNDDRLPHEANKIQKKISKTALGAELSDIWEHNSDLLTVIDMLKKDGYTIAALEQAKGSTALSEYESPEKIAVILGREVEGIAYDVIGLADITLEIPMYGNKESFNVVQAAAMLLYHCRFVG